MNKLKKATLLAVILTVGLVGTAFSNEKFLIDYASQPPSFASISINNNILWEVPIKDVAKVSKEEWRDIVMLIRLAQWGSGLDEKTMKTLIKTISPKRFIRKAN